MMADCLRVANDRHVTAGSCDCNVDPAIFSQETNYPWEGNDRHWYDAVHPMWLIITKKLIYFLNLKKKFCMGSCQSQGLHRSLKVRAKKGGKGDKGRGNQKVERWLLMLRLNWDRLWVAGKQDTGSEFQSKAVRGKKLDEYRWVFALGTDTVWGCEWAEKRVVRPKVRLGGTTSESPLEHLPL